LFDVIQMPFVAGDPKHALDDPHAVVLSEKSATKLFGSEQALGKTITLVSGNIKADYRVTGVFKDLPKNTNLNFGLVARFNPQDYWRDSPAAYQSWNDQEGSYWVR
jgi:putative ABC transport system permease protein